ncbi:MAG: uracil-DNA glycosylase [Candidatus Nitrosocaldus sp.]|nr:uracil-DNA glycosylase [Candidatus Nitrosocaldus sp.]MDW8276081.1 uracil-DNA glycosylase [Candidatus Nitrosocaldus sp.]
MSSYSDNDSDSILRVAEEVRACSRCRLAVHRRNAVPGEGSSSALLMFIGEAPGRREDELARPFVGHAGRILDDALSMAGIDRSSVYITNVVKCRPPMNRRPRRDEIRACKQYLEREIMLVNPRIICLMGRTAHDSLLYGQFREHRGACVEHNGRLFFTTYHPASIIYNARLKDVFISDMIRLKGIASAARINSINKVD